MPQRTVGDVIARAVLREGRVWVQTTAEAVADGLHVELGDLPVALVETAEAPPAEDVAFAARFPLDPGAVERTDGLFDCGVNELVNWSLPETDTMHLKFSNPGGARGRVAGPVTVPGGKQALTFRALLACHRARARLELRLAPAEGGEDVVRAVTFDPTRVGGLRADRYQKVTIPIPPAPKPRLASLHVVYEGLTDQKGETDPFVFIAGAEIAAQQATAALPSAILIEGRAGGAGAWYKAELPVDAAGPDSEIALVLHGDRLTLFGQQEAGIRLLEDYGHTMILESPVAQAAVLYVDGRALAKQSLQSGRTDIRLPVEALRGEPVLVQLRDPSGSRILFQSWTMAPRILTPVDVLQREDIARIPAHLFVQSAHRYAALRAHLADPASASFLAEIPRWIDTLEGGYDRVRLFPLAFPPVAEPVVSVVIPCHNKVEVTFSCLCALRLAHNRTTFEVILVDDGSTDDTARIEDWVSGITVVRNAEAQRFIRACNAGAAQARGRFVVLLNNDTEPTAGWLDALVDAFGRFPKVGLAGAKLLFPDGRLQDAGGIVWGSGNPWQYGSKQNPWDPRFCYARQADYLPGAAMMTTRAIWDEVGGLSAYLEPMYFEDTDFAFKVREAGYTTWFVPSSVVYHNEGTTSGTDTSAGYKRFQEVNRPKFKRRWARAFAGHGTEGQNPDLEKDRGILGRVLFIDYTTPRHDRDAGGYAAVQEMRLVQSLGYKVTFLPENLAHFGSATEEIERMGVEMAYAPFYLSVAEFLTQRAAEFDAFYVTRYHVAANVLGRLRELAPKAKVILNTADLHFLRTLRAGLAAGDPHKLAEARRIRDAELDVMRKVDLVLSYNDVERSVVESLTDAPINMRRCPWVVDVPAEVPPLSARRGMSFLGSFRHHPNLEGLEWFLREVMPQLAGRPGAPDLSIYGSSMTPEIRKKLAGPQVSAVGFVEDAALAYDPHRIFIAPLLAGAGIKGKVLTALARGIPCVLSPVAAEGIGLRNGLDCLIAETPADWVQAIMTLAEDDALWSRMAEAGRAFMASEYSFAAGRRMMQAALEAVELFSPLE